MRRDSGLFKYWSDGNHDHEVHADPPAANEAFPFHVYTRTPERPFGGGVIPMSILVFARDARHAKSRVMQSLREVAAKDYKESERDLWGSGHNARELLSALKSGKYVMTVYPFDSARISCYVNWASNGGIT